MVPAGHAGDGHAVPPSRSMDRQARRPLICRLDDQQGHSSPADQLGCRKHVFGLEEGIRLGRVGGELPPSFDVLRARDRRAPGSQRARRDYDLAGDDRASAENARDDPAGRVDLVLADDERRQKPQRAGPGDVDDQALRRAAPARDRGGVEPSARPTPTIRPRPRTSATPSSAARPSRSAAPSSRTRRSSAGSSITSSAASAAAAAIGPAGEGRAVVAGLEHLAELRRR